MQFTAIVERRLLQWYLYLPTLGTEGPVSDPNDVQASADALAAAATGLSPADVQVSLHLSVQSNTVLPAPPTDAEVQHTDGSWRAAQQTGWVRLSDTSWRVLVGYVAEGATWKHAIHTSRLRHPQAAIPAPRAGVESLTA
jgi:hypothetical protein